MVSPSFLSYYIIKLTGNEDRHKISDEFEFWSYLTSQFGVTSIWCYMPLSSEKKNLGQVQIPAISDQSFWSCVPLSSEKNDVSSFSQSPLIWSLSNLQVTRTGMKARTSSNFGQIGVFTLELFALECEIFSPHRLIMEKMMSPLFSSPVVWRPHSLKIFSSETTGPVKVKFRMEPPWDGGTKVQTVLVTWPRWPPCPYMVKTLKNLLLQNQKAYDLETWYAASGARVLPSLFKWWRWFDLDLFYSKVKFGPLCFCMGKR